MKRATTVRNQQLVHGERFFRKAHEVGNMYEDYAYSLSKHFMIGLPGRPHKGSRDDNWMLTNG